MFECRAALRHLSGSGPAGALAAAAAGALLSLSCCLPSLAAAPAAVEAWREAWGAGDCATRALRDAALFPFFGNSIATRLRPAPPPPGDAGASPGDADVLDLGSFRAAQRVRLLVGPGVGSGHANGSHRNGSSGGRGGSSSGHWGVHGGGAGAAEAEALLATEGPGPGAAAAVWVVNTHLDHATPQERARQAQASRRGGFGGLGPGGRRLKGGARGD